MRRAQIFGEIGEFLGRYSEESHRRRSRKKRSVGRPFSRLARGGRMGALLSLKSSSRYPKGKLLPPMRTMNGTIRKLGLSETAASPGEIRAVRDFTKPHLAPSAVLVNSLREARQTRGEMRGSKVKVALKPVRWEKTRWDNRRNAVFIAFMSVSRAKKISVTTDNQSREWKKKTIYEVLFHFDLERKFASIYQREKFMTSIFKTDFLVAQIYHSLGRFVIKLRFYSLDYNDFLIWFYEFWWILTKKKYRYIFIIYVN